METSWAFFGDGQRAVRGDAGDPDAGPELEVGIWQLTDVGKYQGEVVAGSVKTRPAGTTVYSWALPLAGRPEIVLDPPRGSAGDRRRRG